MAAIQFFHGEQRENARVGSVCCVVLFDQLIVLINLLYIYRQPFMPKRRYNVPCKKPQSLFTHPLLLLLLLLTDKLEFSFDMISELYLLILSHNLIKIIFL